MHIGFIKTAAIIGAISVALGAFAAHSLKQNISTEALNIFETAVRYQFYHVFALLAVGLLYKDFMNNSLIWSGRFFITGIILFSGSLYLLTYFKAIESIKFNWLGAITPIGGLALILGWIFLFTGCNKKSLVFSK
jgi:uncharacterized membrane protein YgdD (TMEM256/DUF423 family)